MHETLKETTIYSIIITIFGYSSITNIDYKIKIFIIKDNKNAVFRTSKCRQQFRSLLS